MKYNARRRGLASILSLLASVTLIVGLSASAAQADPPATGSGAADAPPAIDLSPIGGGFHW